MKKHSLIRDEPFKSKLNRRNLLRRGMAGLGRGAAIGALASTFVAPSLFGRVTEAAAQAARAFRGSQCEWLLLPKVARASCPCIWLRCYG